MFPRGRNSHGFCFGPHWFWKVEKVLTVLEETQKTGRASSGTLISSQVSSMPCEFGSHGVLIRLNKQALGCRVTQVRLK